MKYRVMTSDKPNRDFDTEAEARVLFDQEKKRLGGARLLRALRRATIAPACNIHRCFHDETPPKTCEVIEKWEKQ